MMRQRLAELSSSSSQYLPEQSAAIIKSLWERKYVVCCCIGMYKIAEVLVPRRGKEVEFIICVSIVKILIILYKQDEQMYLCWNNNNSRRLFIGKLTLNPSPPLFTPLKMLDWSVAKPVLVRKSLTAPIWLPVFSPWVFPKRSPWFLFTIFWSSKFNPEKYIDDDDLDISIKA